LTTPAKVALGRESFAVTQGCWAAPPHLAIGQITSFTITSSFFALTTILGGDSLLWEAAATIIM